MKYCIILSALSLILILSIACTREDSSSAPNALATRSAVTTTDSTWGITVAGAAGVGLGAIITGVFTWLATSRLLRQQTEHSNRTFEYQQKSTERMLGQEAAAVRAEYTKLHVEHVLWTYQRIARQFTRFRDEDQKKRPSDSLLEIVGAFNAAYPFLGKKTVKEFDTKILPLAEPHQLKTLDHERM